MPDIAAISSVLSSIKIASDIAQLLRSGTLSLEQAEAELKLAELITALADVKMEMSSVRDLVAEKDAQIGTLQEAANIKGKLTYQAPYYWLVEEGKRDGPYCQTCYDRDKTLIRLQARGNGLWVCNSCDKTYLDSSYRQESVRAKSDWKPRI